jgi:DNA modification methylase
VTPSWRIIVGDAAQTVSTLPAASVQCCVTSPPYYSLRDYGVDGQIGLEDTPDEYVQRLVDVFREVRRVIRDDGTVWINLGDSYAATSTYSSARSMHTDAGWKQAGRRPGSYAGPVSARTAETAKPKDLLGIPWSVAFALRADGWYLRQEIIFAKTAPMPESVRDRCTRAHEMVFMLSKRPTYFYDQEALKVPQKREWDPATNGPVGANGHRGTQHAQSGVGEPVPTGTANRRSVWTLGPEPFTDAHFAVMPGKLARDCVLAGSPEKSCGACGAPWERVVERRALNEKVAVRVRNVGGRSDGLTTPIGGVPPVAHDTVGWRASCEHDDPSGSSVVLDPFSGAGTTGVQALRAGRSYVGVELNAGYAELARNRIRDDAPLMNVPAEDAA